MKNEMEIVFDAVSQNESFARVAVAAFVANVNLTLEEVADIKTAVSEAVTNAVIHGYANPEGYPGQGKTKLGKQEIHEGKIRLYCRLEQGILHVEVEDKGVGIENVDKAMEPLFTTKPELNRSGLGFAFMEAFMDELEVTSTPGKGTLVRMKKKLEAGDWIHSED